MPFSKDPAAYPPELLELFRRGYEKPLTIKLENRAMATSLRHRLHAYRRALHHSASPYATIASSCVVRVSDNVLTIEPSTLEIRKALADAGIPFDSQLTAEALKKEEDVASAALDEVLKGQGFGKS